MKYMFLIYGTEDAWTPEEREACMVESMGHCRRLEAEGKYLDSAPLQPVATAVTVRVREGRSLVTDGPFAETHEQLAGYYVLDLENLDEAIAVAAKLPPAAKGTVEIRPLCPLEGLPEARPSIEAEGIEGLRPYLLLCNGIEEAWEAAGPEALAAARDEAAGNCRRLAESGRYLSASPLHGSVTATCVRVRDGKRSITDGPFAETTEVLGGYILILAATVEEAVEEAARHPGARLGSVEVRPLHDLSDLRAKV